MLLWYYYFISFTKHSDDPLQDFTYGCKTYTEKELLNFQMYSPVWHIYPGGSTPTFHNELWFQTNLLPPVSLYMSLSFDKKSVKNQVSETIAALMKSCDNHLHHFSI